MSIRKVQNCSFEGTQMRRTQVFGKTMVRCLLAAALTMAMLAGTTMADAILPTGLAPGTQYQIAFVTADTINGASGSASTYNDFVTAQTALSPSLASLGASWTAITTTADGTNACDNAPAYAGVPIYNTLGQPLSTAGALYMIWDSYWGWLGGLDHPINADQYGLPVAAGVWVWTGSQPDGRVSPSGAFQLGDTTITNQAIFGDPGSTTNSQYWMTAGHDNLDYLGTTIYHPVYALSSRITVPAPEPGTLALLGSALLGLGVVYLRRRGAKA
jgi:hypothetical protein